jgi:hypothetical protein
MGYIDELQKRLNKCCAGDCGFSVDERLWHQARWFLEAPRESAERVWRKWKHGDAKRGRPPKDPRYMADLERRIELLKEGKGPQ